jgi:hypothetical protein
VSSAAPKHEARVRAEVADFLSSSHAARFAPPARNEVGAVAREFLDACYGDVGVRPDLLDAEHLREVLLDILPRRLDPKSPISARTPEIVRALLDHLFEQKANANAWSLDAIFDEARAHFAARLAAGGGRDQRAGSPEPLKRPGSKLGRNDPCPCGSGKKFKKCCAKEG